MTNQAPTPNFPNFPSRPSTTPWIASRTAATAGAWTAGPTSRKPAWTCCRLPCAASTASGSGRGTPGVESVHRGRTRPALALSLTGAAGDGRRHRRVGGLPPRTGRAGVSVLRIPEPVERHGPEETHANHHPAGAQRTPGEQRLLAEFPGRFHRPWQRSCRERAAKTAQSGRTTRVAGCVVYKGAVCFRADEVRYPPLGLSVPLGLAVSRLGQAPAAALRRLVRPGSRRRRSGDFRDFVTPIRVPHGRI